MTFVREIKDTSITIKSTFLSFKSLSFKSFMCISSIETTFSLFLNFQSSWFFPTSTLNTSFAPFCKEQSVNPPVEAPMSKTSLSLKSKFHIFIAFSNFNPPRLTYFSLSLILIFNSSVSLNIVPAFVTLCSLTMTFPAIISLLAFSLVSKKFFSTSNKSSLFFIFIPFVKLFC